MKIATIDTRHGTDSTPQLSNGNTLPLTGVPFGTNYFAPQTGSGNWWFNPKATCFSGIRLTHQASPWMGDYCYFSFLPLTNDVECSSVIYNPQKSFFNPNKLKIESELGQCLTELIPTDKGALIKIDYHGPKSIVKFQFNQLSGLEWTDKEISGIISQANPKYSYPLKMYFSIEFSNKFDIQQMDKEYILEFFGNRHLEMRLGTSYIDMDFAKRNIPKEPMLDLTKQISDIWEKKLNKVIIQDQNEKNVKTFYHNFYRCFLFPQRSYELDDSGMPIHFDMYTNTIKPGYLYVNTGFWDTAKTIFPLFTLIEKEELTKMAAGFINSYRESGYLPKWLAPEEKGAMPGTMIDTLIADWVSKDLFRDDWEELLQGMIKSAEVHSDKADYGRIHLEAYNSKGYVSSDCHESVNHTLDYSYSDFCIAKVAEKLSKDTVYEKYSTRAANFVNLFDEDQGFIRPKDNEGEFVNEFLPNKWGDGYAESSAWQSGFLIFHDVQKLIDCFGFERFEKRLIQMANKLPDFQVGSYHTTIHEMVEMAQNDFGQLNVGNQPGFHLPYLSHFIGKPEYAQPVLKMMMRKLFQAEPKGYPGDEDNGSMSAWFIFNSLGLYPFCPGSGEYLLGIPLFEKATIYFEDDTRFTILADQTSEQHQFVDAVLLNNQLYKKSFIKHETVISGGELKFELGCFPNPEAFHSEERPYSFSKELQLFTNH